MRRYGVAGAAITFLFLLASAQAAVGPGWSLQHPATPAGASSTSLNDASCLVDCTSVGAYVKGKSTLPLAERWSGKKWSIQHPASPKGTKKTVLLGVSCFTLRMCTAVGYSVAAGGRQIVLAERWKGNKWSLQHVPRRKGKGSALDGISCTTGNTCTAVGAYATGKGGRVATLAERWNGKKWSTEHPHNPAGAAKSYLEGVWCTWSSNCTAVGYFISKTGTALPMAEHWSGKKWSLRRLPVPPGAANTYVVSVACPAAGACIAVGYFEDSVNADEPLAEQSKGAKWSLQRPPAPTGALNSFLEGVSCTATNACTGVGYFEDSTSADMPLGERLNKGGWSVARPPSSKSATNGFLNGVSCPSTTSCLAVGYDDNGGTVNKPLADRWK